LAKSQPSVGLRHFRRHRVSGIVTCGSSGNVASDSGVLGMPTMPWTHARRAQPRHSRANRPHRNRSNADFEGNGFTWAGTLQTNVDGRAVLFARFRTCVKVAGDGLAAGGNTTLPPTDMEQHAIEQMRQEMSKPVDEARLRALQEGRSCDDRGNRL
jgi:hypothetical protein